MICELNRHYKHLVDSYSCIHQKINISLLKKYINDILSFEDKAKEKYHIPHYRYEYRIEEDKVFTKSYFLTAIQAGYTLDEEEMIQALNKWMKDNLQN